MASRLVRAQLLPVTPALVRLEHLFPYLYVLLLPYPRAVLLLDRFLHGSPRNPTPYVRVLLRLRTGYTCVVCGTSEAVCGVPCLFVYLFYCHDTFLCAESQNIKTARAARGRLRARPRVELRCCQAACCGDRRRRRRAPAAGRHTVTGVRSHTYEMNVESIYRESRVRGNGGCLFL